nr:GGDEF domain-containing protein [Sphingomonas laterariae]
MALAPGLFLVCLAGILSQPYLGLSTFWPANAFMLGMLVRFPGANRLSVWLNCALAFFLADLLMGTSLVRNLTLNGGNLATVATACYLLRPLSQYDRILKGRKSTIHVLRAILVASLVAGMFGIFANPLLFGGSSKEGFLFWTATEMVNYVTFLPVLLTLPRATAWKVVAARQWIARSNPRNLLPLLALIGSIAGAVLVGGRPGAALFPIPALLWCALAYDLFLTACVSLGFALWTLFALRTGLMWSPTELAARSDVISVRLGVSLVALTPIAVGSVVAARNDLLQRYRLLADYDPLTNLRNRRAFLDAGGAALDRSLDAGQSAAVMMLDLDHFKSINDQYGHRAGDEVLAAFASTLKNLVRAQDVVGRLGGEEFAVVLPDCTLVDAGAIAERINSALRSGPVGLEDGRSIQTTVSIGVHVERSEPNLENALGLADAALYHAKHNGRNRFEISSKASLASAAA